MLPGIGFRMNWQQRDSGDLLGVIKVFHLQVG